MEYTIIVNGQSYDLPKKTIQVVEKLDDVLRVDSTNLKVKQKFEKLHAFVKGIVGEDAAKEMFGSDDLSEIDLSELTITVKKINDAYEAPVNEYSSDRMSCALDNLPIDKVVQMSKMIESMSAMTKGNKQ